MNEPETMRLLSLGQLAGDHQRSVAELEVAMLGVNALPRLVLNRVAYYETADVVKALELLQAVDAKRRAQA